MRDRTVKQRRRKSKNEKKKHSTVPATVLRPRKDNRQSRSGTSEIDGRQSTRITTMAETQWHQRRKAPPTPPAAAPPPRPSACQRILPWILSWCNIAVVPSPPLPIPPHCEVIDHAAKAKYLMEKYCPIPFADEYDEDDSDCDEEREGHPSVAVAAPSPQSAPFNVDLYFPGVAKGLENIHGEYRKQFEWKEGQYFPAGGKSISDVRKDILRLMCQQADDPRNIGVTQSSGFGLPPLSEILASKGGPGGPVGGCFQALAIETDRDPDSTWMIDSGASSHMVIGSIPLIGAVYNPTGIIRLADGSELTGTRVGQVNLNIDDKNDTRIKLNNVISHPKLRINLLSVSAITKAGGRVVFEGGTATIYSDGGTGVLLKIKHENGLYAIRTKAADTALAAVITSTVDEQNKWHYRMGHLSVTGMEDIIRLKSVHGLAGLSVEHRENLCEGCMLGKFHRAKFARDVPEERKATAVMDRIHADLCGCYGAVFIRQHNTSPIFPHILTHIPFLYFYHESAIS